jgi:hypothetical protein
VPHDIFASVYRLIEPSSVTAANVHDLGHYLGIPAVHQFLFQLLFRFVPTPDEKAAAEDEYAKHTLEGNAKALQAAFGDLQAGDGDKIAPLLESAKALKDMVKGFGGEF